MISRGDLLRAHLEIVERHACEMGVTLLIHGTSIRGILTPWIRYERWHTEVFARGEDTVPGAELPLLTESQREEVRATWTQSHPDGAFAPGEYEEHALLAIMNAEILSASGAVSQRFPFLLVHMGSISAFVFLHGRPSRDLPA